jgi:hypothetical protein
MWCAVCCAVSKTMRAELVAEQQRAHILLAARDMQRFVASFRPRH